MKKMKFKKMKRASLEAWIEMLRLSLEYSKQLGYDDSDGSNLILANLEELLNKLYNVIDMYGREFTFQITISQAVAMRIHYKRPQTVRLVPIDQLSMYGIMALIDPKFNNAK